MSTNARAVPSRYPISGETRISSHGTKFGPVSVGSILSRTQSDRSIEGGSQ